MAKIQVHLPKLLVGPAALFPSWLVSVPSAAIFLLDDDIWLVFLLLERWWRMERLLMVHGVFV